MEVSRLDEIYASIITFTLALVGIITNGAAVGVILHMRHLHNAFGYSCMSHAIGGLGVLVIFAIWVPFQLLVISETLPNFLKSERLAYTVGQITIIFYYGAIYTHVLIGLNRYVAISKPFSYGKYFDDRKTIQWIALIWMIAFLQSCAYQLDGCHYYYDRSVMLFVYSEALCGRIISLYFEFYVNLVFVIFVVVLDILTFWKLNKMIKVMSNQEGNERETRGRKAQECRFFFQSVCSETALVLCFLCFWCVAIYAPTPFTVFLFNFGAWEILHIVDGIIMVVFNHRICNSKKKQIVVSVISSGLITINNDIWKRRFNARDRWLNLSKNRAFNIRIKPFVDKCAASTSPISQAHKLHF